MDYYEQLEYLAQQKEDKLTADLKMAREEIERLQGIEKRAKASYLDVLAYHEQYQNETSEAIEKILNVILGEQHDS